MTFIIIADNSYGMGIVWLKVYQNTVAHVFYIQRLYLIASGALLIAFPTVSVKKKEWTDESRKKKTEAPMVQRGALN